MPAQTFKKDILRPAKHLVTTRGGGRREENFDLVRLQGHVEKFNQMKAKGLRIPAPWRHDGSKPVKFTSGKAPLDFDSRNNGGFWEKLYIENGLLCGEIESESSDAGKIGTDVREVSPHIGYGYKDGDGNLWDDAILHIALVTHPVVNGQSNFQPVLSGDKMAAVDEFAVSMSNQIGEADLSMGDKATSVHATGATAQEAIVCLKAAGITLPDDTTPENFIERIVIACTALAAVQNGDSVDEEASELKPPAIAMSNTVPDDKKVLTQEDITLSINDPAKNPFIGLANANALKGYERRIADLVETRITQDYADKRLTPRLKDFSLSMGQDGKPVPSELDRILDDLEALPPRNEGFFGMSQGGEVDQDEEEVVKLPKDYRGRELAASGKALDDSVAEQQKMAGRT